MADKVVPGPVESSAAVLEAVCIHTRKIFDSCRDKDCVEDLRVYPTRSSQAVIDRALSVRPSYIALGHIFPTQTKVMPSSPQGLEQLTRHLARLSDYPTVAIGGISIARAPSVLATGVGSIAVVSAITQAPDWQQATQHLLELAGHGDE